MEAKGLPSTWMDLIMKTVTSDKVEINVNGEIWIYFSTHQGLWQGNPLSPILFNIVVDMLAILIERAKEDVKLEV
jgi:hypothetical protein